MNARRCAIGRGSLLVLGVLLACAGCQIFRPVPAPANGEADPLPSPPQQVAEVKLRPGFVVRVQVLVMGKTELDEQARRISDAGVVTLPLIGNVYLADLTIAEAQAMLRTMYSRYYVNSEVIVECVMDGGEAASPWGYVTVLGRVRKPGPVNVPPTRDLTVSRAIQMAGGLDTSARSDAIRVTRTLDDRTERFTVDLDRIGSSGRTTDDVPLLPGDVVYVPEALL